MISIDVKPEVSASSSTLASSKEDEPTLSFASLLQGISLKKDEKIVQNGALVLALVDEKNIVDVKLSSTEKTLKTDALLTLLQGNSEEGEELPLELNPKLTQVLDVTELKALVLDAKNYLKSKIIESSEFKQFELKNLPKTLKGLAQVAQKFGIDISKITLEEVRTTSKELSLDTKVKKGTLLQTKNEKVEDTALEDTDIQRQVRIDDKKIQKVQDLKQVPLFKAVAKTEHTTEELVLTKLAHTETRATTKKKADTTLQQLLSGDKTLKQESSLTADFAVASAKVTAPKVTTANTSSLESLLKGDSSPDATDITKLETSLINKADSFEVKLNEAKQLTKYLSQDVKTAIEDYKSPFTRIKVQLNPQRLGEVDLTIVQRGKNLHISLSSNNVAINTLALNAQDLKTQLANNGINNASLNFNNNSQGDQQSAAGQHQQQNQGKKAQDEYDYFEQQEANEEIVTSLEIVVPRYV